MIVGAPPDFDRLSAPDVDGGVLIAPAMHEWPALIAANRDARRAWGFANSHQAYSDVHVERPPVILLGHQPEFMHPGVWIKGAAGMNIANAVQGVAEFLVVDHDAPEKLSLAWPAERDGRLVRVEAPSPFAMRAQPFELQSPMPNGWLSTVLPRDIIVGNGTAAGFAAPAAAPPVMSAFASAFDMGAGPARGADGGDYVSRWMAGVHSLDRHIGFDGPRMVRSSQMSTLSANTCLSWGAFATSLIEAGKNFAQCYNACLGNYRRRHGIRSHQHPVPDLRAADDLIELPLWLYHKGDESRRRLWVDHSQPGVCRVFADTQAIMDWRAGEQVLSHNGDWNGWHLRPRALTLTLFARMFVCDFFIHGLGGAKYDEITDDLIRQWYGVHPPAYACVTATLRLPLPRTGVSSSDVAAAQRARRDGRWNPQSVLAPERLDAEVAAQRALAAAESDRLRRDQPRQHAARRRVYDHIHQLSQRLRAADADLDARLETRLAQLHAFRQQDAVAASREWFYGLHTNERLRALLKSIR